MCILAVAVAVAVAVWVAHKRVQLDVVETPLHVIRLIIGVIWIVTARKNVNMYT
jgi:Na+/glutamate symporter